MNLACLDYSCQGIEGVSLRILNISGLARGSMADANADKGGNDAKPGKGDVAAAAKAKKEAAAKAKAEAAAKAKADMTA